MEIKEILEEIKKMPNTFVDCNFGQGEDILRQYFVTEKININQIDLYISNSIKYIDTLQKMFRPRNIPQDYILFLQNYGGLTIHKEASMLNVFGVGPLADVEYIQVVDANKGSLASGNKNVLIARGSIHLSSNERNLWKKIREADDKLPRIVKENEPTVQNVHFFIDIQENIKKDSIVFVKQIDILMGKGKMTMVANSFAEWLITIFEAGCNLNRISVLFDN